jgi:hypothetical protein
MAAYDLTTLAAVRELLQPSGTSQDALISSSISRVSRHIINRYGKFLPAETAAAKVFVFSNANELARLSLHPYFLRSLTSVQFDTNGSTPTTLTATDYQLRPTAPLDGVYRWIRFPAYRTQVGLERTVTVTGNWGFENLAAVPEDVQEACILAVVERVRGAAAFTSQFPNDETGQPERPVALPRASRVLLSPYDGWGQG